MFFRVYYHDGTTFESDQPELVPTEKYVAAIAWNDPVKGAADLGRVVVEAWDIYIYSDGVGGWHGTNKYSDLMNHLKTQDLGPGGVRVVLDGLWIDNESFKAIIKRAKKDPGLDRKSATNPLREDGHE